MRCLTSTLGIIVTQLAIFPGTFSANSSPHIILIVADDLGWNDVGFHGSNQIPTPNIDALAYSGVILNKYYVTPICTPSRSALMTGKYPIHTGMQRNVIRGSETRGLPLHEKILPQYLEDLGYSNHIVGKWHLGSFKREYSPTYRGFHSHLGYWLGCQDYYDHTLSEDGLWGLDMRRGTEPAWDLHGQYATDIYTNEAVRIIDKHNSSRPLFLYLAHVAVHSAGHYDPLQAPDSVVKQFTNISDYSRKKFAGMITKLDESVGKVLDVLRKKKMLHNSVIVFTTDNGGPAEGFNNNAASNWPLRGVKNTYWEGGLRGAALFWTPMLKRPRRISDEMMHISDWLPTLISAAGGNSSDAESIDGFDMWASLLENTPSPRTKILHNIDDTVSVSSVTVGAWKVIDGTTYKGSWDGWYGPSGRDDLYQYSPTLVMNSPAGKAVASIGMQITLEQILGMRHLAEVRCSSKKGSTPCFPLNAPCLYNVEADPCEQDNLAKRYPETLELLLAEISEMNKTAVPPNNTPNDPRANPLYWDNTWANFGDYIMQPEDQ